MAEKIPFCLFPDPSTMRFHSKIQFPKRHLHWLILLLFAFQAGCGGENPAEKKAPEAQPDSSADLQPLTEPAAPVKDYIALLSFMVPEDYEFAVSEEGPIVAEGDLNGDNLPDIVFLLQNLEEEMPKSQILIAYQTQDGKYEPGERSGNFGPEPTTYLDPEFFKISNQILQVNYQSMRWGIELKFRKEKKYGDLRLIGSESFNYGNAFGEGAGSTSTNYLTGKSEGHYKHVDPNKPDGEKWSNEEGKVSTQLLPFQGFSDDNVYELQ
jgi:hypothetical protein